jgi:hypothetical protein
MNRKALLLSFLTALSGTCAGCVTRPPELKPVGKATVRASREVRPTRATVQMANEVTILLPAPNPPGYVWQIAQHDVNALKQLTGLVPAADPPGAMAISFLALRPGVTRVLFALVPPGPRPERESAEMQDIQLVIE